ncbi:GntR family transcriptional regulator [Streptomyces sp. NPDC088337]|uniref:GntR family transcriptional regulator n=1 Tax=unclassified Streptomyces TaxID=2593676 RepID=UPI00381E7364
MQAVRGDGALEGNPRGTYLVISEKLRERIRQEDSTEVLPSEADLMREHGVGRNTVRRALKVLEAEGVLESAPGIGWRIVRSGDRRSLAERMSALIAEESLSVGDPYPSESQLCSRFGASRTAVRRVLAQMEGNGLLATVHGKGRTVRALPTPVARS